MTHASKSPDQAAIEKLDEEWGKAASAKQLDAVVAFYAADGTLVWPDLPAVHGSADIRSHWQEMMKIPGLALRFTPERIDVSEAGDLAIDFGAVHLRQDTDSGPQSEIDKYLVVWKKVDGAWKVLYDSYNSNTASG